MVDMRMGQNERVDLGWPKWEVAVVQLSFALRALHHAAIEEYFCAACLEEEAGSRNGSAGAVKVQAHQILRAKSPFPRAVQHDRN